MPSSCLLFPAVLPQVMLLLEMTSEASRTTMIFMGAQSQKPPLGGPERASLNDHADDPAVPTPQLSYLRAGRRKIGFSLKVCLCPSGWSNLETVSQWVFFWVLLRYQTILGFFLSFQSFFKKELFIYLFIWLLWVLTEAWGIFSCRMWNQLGIEPRTLTSGRQSLSHWTTREVPQWVF